MKIGKPLSFVGTLGACWLITIIFFSSCKTDSDPFAAINFYDQDLGTRIKAYQNSTHPESKQTSAPALYIDFSSGINKAFANSDIKNMMSDCFNTILAQKFEVYKLGSKTITSLNVANSTELGQKVSDKNQYIDIWAPIQTAVEKIVARNGDALLITDFEEWQGNEEVTSAAFLKISFIKWIEQGNSIQFFISNYKENNVDKHLYFTVFTYGKPSSASLISKLDNKLSTLTTRFDLSNQSYQLHTSYPSPKSGGIFYDDSAKSDQAKNILDLKNGYFNEFENSRPFEFYPLGVDWESIAKLHTSYQSQQQFNDLFRNLFINLSNIDSYHYGDFEVKVSDITIDFETFAKAEEAKKHKPKLAKGNNGETKIADNESDAIALACYTKDGNLKKEWNYQPQPATPIDNTLTLNQALFKNTRSSDLKNAELGIAFDPKFDIKSIPNPDGLIKIDIVLKDATPNLTGEKLTFFQWKNVGGVPNVALLESIKNTLQEQKPTNKIIFSYYIKTKQN